MEIRPYLDSDEAAVVELWRTSFPDAPAWNDPLADIQRKLSIQREMFLVAVEDGNVIGTAMGGYDGHRGWVYYLAVHDGMRRCGVGRALMTRLEEILWQTGCEKLNLQVRASNAAVVEFYERLGYGIEERVSMGKKLTLARSRDDS